MRYYVRNSELNEVKEVIAYNGEVNSNWFTEVEKPDEDTINELKGLGEFSPFVVTGGKVTKDNKKDKDIKDLELLEQDLIVVGCDYDIDEILEQIIENLPQGQGNKFVEFKERRQKQKEIKELKNKLKGGK